MKKLANHIILSGVTVSMLFSPLMALPSGGKFTHGTSGSINKPNDKTMNIIGNGKNSIIQWGGGFNIGKGESVNFGGTDKNYLNIAHGASKSTIEGVLNAGGNNVFLINPNGVIIEKSGSIINANRFVASTTSLQAQHFEEFKAQGASFSPVFKPNPKGGNVVNMGNINANNVLLIGNKVDIQGGRLGNEKSTTHLVGKNVYIDADSTNLNSTINVTATEGGYIQRQMINFAKDKYRFGDNVKINVVNYKDSSGATHIGSSNFKKALTIGNMGNEKDNAIEWWHFAKGWNEDLGDIRNIDEFRLVGNIDFSGNQGKGVEGKDWQNYANYCIEGLGCTNMIVGFGGDIKDGEVIYNNAFTADFDGQGYTLKNIFIDTTKIPNSQNSGVGIFGATNGANFKNINIDYMGGGINASSSYVGGFIGIIDSGIYSSITINNIKEINNNDKSHPTSVGGFAGWIDEGTFCNISINKINKIYNTGEESFTGGFAGWINHGNPYFEQIIINNINSIKSESDSIHLPATSSSGGFAGRIDSGKYNSIAVMGVDEIIAISANYGKSGGFAGWIDSGKYNNIAVMGVDEIIAISTYLGSSGGFVGDISGTNPDFSSITLNNIENITANSKSAWGNVNSGGFAGSIYSGKFNNISLNHIQNIKSSYTPENESEWATKQVHAGGFAGLIWRGIFENISIYDVKNIHAINNAQYHGSDFERSGSHAGGFAGYIALIFNNYKPKFNNIYMYFTPNSIIKSESKLNENYAGKFAGRISVTNNTNPDISNIHIYHHENDLNNATADKSYWGNTDDKIQIHTYNDNNQESVYKDFLSKANTIEKPEKPTPPTNPDNPNDSDVILGSDDLYSDVIMEWIIKEIREKNYTISIEKLASLINAFKTLDKDSSEDEIKTIVKAHLGIKDDNEALSMAQSISFLLNYQEHNFDGRLNKEALDAYNTTIKPNVNNTLGIISYLDKNKDELQKQYDEYLQIKNNFDKAHQAYKNSEAEFNRLLDLVNKGKLSYNDPKFTQAFDNWLNAYNEYNALSNDITKLNDNVLNIASGITDKDKGLGYTNFSFVKFDDITKIDLIKPEFPDIDNSQGGNLPDFEQTASLNLIGDKAIDEEEETEEVDETSLIQKGKICIVSDNSKTMNPCIVGGL
ncbi:Filamentous haemagglutinin domain protein [Campylobacter lari]|uniref:filamentous hemagglutinin N-terminal domain-containing protein n=1 Tax=Campylobacter lari TaxID=201 RepID=UPI000DF109DA|nr:filamentous hemagglutinin N-terminal domain-containing protein [Campylobacter lari]STA75983.1 Filamentous haemagglutinin domain protein [Campylobacter lari]